MIDANKAFDRVEYCKLVGLRLFLGKKLPTIVIRVSLQMYLFLFTQVSCNGTLSKHFLVVNGVRKNAILSPILRCVYLKNLDSSEIGCHIGSFIVGALAYAGDSVLLALSANAMSSMLHIYL